MTIVKGFNRPEDKAKIIVVKIQLKLHYSRTTGQPKTDIFKLARIIQYIPTDSDGNPENQTTPSLYFIEGVKRNLRYHSTQLKDYYNKNQLIDLIFGTPKRRSLIIFHIPPVAFLPNNDVEFDHRVQIYHPHNQSLLFEIDVSQLDFEQTSFLVASILRFYHSQTERGVVGKRIGALTIKIVDRTLTVDMIPKSSNSMKLKRTINDELCGEELKQVINRAKEILRGE